MTDKQDSKMTSDCKAGWMPIDTAPRDGAPVLVWDNVDRTTAYWWSIGGYWTLCVCGVRAEDGEVFPTHWMPLPPPPNND